MITGDVVGKGQPGETDRCREGTDHNVGDLVVNTGHYGAVCYFHGPAYGAQKTGADKMAADMATELRPHNVAAVSIWMGGLDTERARACLNGLRPEVRPTTKRDSAEFTGRLIAALYTSEENGLSGPSLDWR